MLTRARDEDVPCKILGRGANVLVSDDGFDGVVVRLDAPAFRRMEFRDHHVEVGAGTDLTALTRICVRRGLAGLEAMAGIPATVGGAVRMNAGGRGGEFSDVVRSVRVMAADGAVEEWPRARCGFGYRHSQLDSCIVLSAALELRGDDPQRVRARFESFLSEKQRTQPLAEHSAGCVFKNPPGQSAGALIDRAGLKGAACGQAVVSHRHANFIVADRAATASDVLGLIDIVREGVRRAFDVELQLEIDVWHPLGEGSLV